MLRHQKKKKGFLLIEGILMLALMTAVAFGMVSIMAGQFSTLSASKEANQAQQLAEYIASQLRQDGYENVEDFDMQESPKSADDFVGNSDLKGKYLYTVKKLSDFEVKEDSYNKVKLMEVKIYPTGYSNVPIYSLEVPLSSQAWAIPVGAVMAWPAEETPTSGGVWLECNGQSIDEKYKRLRELVGDHTPNYQGVFLRGYGSQVASVNQGSYWGNRSQTYFSESLGKIQNDTQRKTWANTGTTVLWSEADYYATLSLPVAFLALGIGEYHFVTHPNIGYYSIDSSGAISSQTGIMDFNPEQKHAADYFHGTAWLMTQPPKKYHLEGDSESGYNLVEEDDRSSGREQFMALGDWAYWPEVGLPMSSENRPVNIAVRYFIKAR